MSSPGWRGVGIIDADIINRNEIDVIILEQNTNTGDYRFQRLRSDEVNEYD